MNKQDKRDEQNNHRLPDKLSNTIVVALDCEAKIHKSKKFSVDMRWWITPQANGVCHVCFAGGVMIKILEADLSRTNITTGDFLESHKLRALDLVRLGRVQESLACFYKDETSNFPDLDLHITDYEENRLAWRLDMFKIVKLLRKHNF